MTLNPRHLKTIFLPLMLATATTFAGGIKANAEEPDTTDATTTLSQPIAREASTAAQPAPQVMPELSSGSEAGLAGTVRVAVTPQPTETRIASRVSESVLPRDSRSAKASALGRVELAQATPVTPTTPTTPNNTPPDSTVPGTVPSGTTPSTTSPGTTTPDTVTPSETPGTITPDTTTPVSPQTTPITPDTTTPDPTTPSTTPGAQPLLPDQQVIPGRATRSGSSYIGVGGNIGIGSGDTALGEGSFAVLSKIGLTPQFSVRPSVLFTDDVTILLPVTYDFNFGAGPTDALGFSAAPFVGVGAGISTGDGGEVGLLLTGGIDVPLTSEFTATASVNATVTGEAAVGILLGVGYNFAGF